MIPHIRFQESADTPNTLSSSYSSDYKLHDTSDLRKYWLKRDGNFDMDSTYTLLQTTGNPKADEFLQLNKKELGHRNSLSKQLLRVYHDYLDSVLSGHYSFNTVNTGDLGHFSFPKTHIMIGRSEDRVADFRAAVDSLLSPKAYEHLRSKESPQNYNIPAINLLREKRLSPIIISSQKAVEMTGKQLKHTLDMLLPYEVKYEPTNWHEVD